MIEADRSLREKLQSLLKMEQQRKNNYKIIVNTNGAKATAGNLEDPTYKIFQTIKDGAVQADFDLLTKAEAKIVQLEENHRERCQEIL